MLRSPKVRISAVLALSVISGVAIVTGGGSATATQGMPVLAGSYNDATAPTVVQNTTVATSCVGDADAGVLGCGSDGVEGIGSEVGVLGIGEGAGTGMAGKAADGIGVAADSANGTAVVADSSDGVAVDVNGKIKLSRSGVATVNPAVGGNLTVVNLPDVTVGTHVIGTVQGITPGVWLREVSMSPATDSFKLILNKTPPSNVKVFWIAIG